MALDATFVQVRVEQSWTARVANQENCVEQLQGLFL